MHRPKACGFVESCAPAWPALRDPARGSGRNRRLARPLQFSPATLDARPCQPHGIREKLARRLTETSRINLSAMGFVKQGQGHTRKFDAIRVAPWLPMLRALPETAVLSRRAHYVHSYSGLVACPRLLGLRENMRTERVCHYSIHGEDVVGAQRFAAHALLFDEPLRNELS